MMGHEVTMENHTNMNVMSNLLFSVCVKHLQKDENAVYPIPSLCIKIHNLKHIICLVTM